jgi:hypothetical protein
MPDDTDLRGARARPSAGRDSRRATERAGLAATRDFLEQIGQFSTSRL